MIERTSGGVIVTSASQIITPTTTLQRFSYTRTLNGGATVAIVQPIIFMTLTIGAAYDFTIRIAAPQMELGAYATTWVPTTTAAVTRIADTFSRNNIFTNGLITTAGGTWFVDLSDNIGYTRDGTSTGLYLDTANSSFTNGFNIRNTGGGVSRLNISKWVAGVGSSLFTTTTTAVKIAIKWNGTTADIFVNGVKQVSATSFTSTNMQFLYSISNQVPLNINQMLLAPTPLSDAECIQLTTL